MGREVWRPLGVRGQAASHTGGGERLAEEVFGRGDAGHCGLVRHFLKEMVTPGAKRDAVAHARNCYGLSERLACHLIGIARRVARYKRSSPDDTDPR